MVKKRSIGGGIKKKKIEVYKKKRQSFCSFVRSLNMLHTPARERDHEYKREIKPLLQQMKSLKLDSLRPCNTFCRSLVSLAASEEFRFGVPLIFYETDEVIPVAMKKKSITNSAFTA